MSYIQASNHAIHWPVMDNIRSFISAKHEAYKMRKVRRKVYNQTVLELSNCSDQALRDLGIFRCDIKRLAKEAASKA